MNVLKKKYLKQYPDASKTTLASFSRLYSKGKEAVKKFKAGKVHDYDPYSYLQYKLGVYDADDWKKPSSWVYADLVEDIDSSESSRSRSKSCKRRSRSKSRSCKRKPGLRSSRKSRNTKRKSRSKSRSKSKSTKRKSKSRSRSTKRSIKRRSRSTKRRSRSTKRRSRSTKKRSTKRKYKR
jgi:hypothetical protein